MTKYGTRRLIEDTFVPYVTKYEYNVLLRMFPGILSFECLDIEVNSDMSSRVL